MTINEYQSLAMRTANDGCKNLANVGLGIVGEAGDVAGIIKKHLFHGRELDRERLAKEFGDVMWYVALGCEVLGYTLEEVMTMNIEKLEQIYPNGFPKEITNN